MVSQDVESSGNPAPSAIVSWKQSRSGRDIPCINNRAQSSVYDPEKEAQRLVLSLQKELKEQPELKSILIVGCGGAPFFEALKQADFLHDITWAVVEPLEEIRNALHEQTSPGSQTSRSPGGSEHRQEWQEAKGHRTLFSKIVSPEQARAFLDQKSCLLFPHRGALQSHVIYRNLFSELNSRAQRKQINRNTLARFGSLWMRNLYANALNLIENQSIDSLKNLYSNQSAIVLGAGPSLADHIARIAELKKQQDSILIIAVDTALSVCRLHSLTPDFVLTVDPQPINFYHLAGESMTNSAKDNAATASSPILIIDPSCSPLALRRWEGKMFSTGNPFPLASTILAFSGKPEPSQLSYGGSVSTNAYDLAFFLGCRRILLVGQDLSFTRTRVHASGSALEELWSFREDRFQSRETGNYRQRFAIPVVSLPGESRPTVHSNDKLQVFYQWFSDRFAKDKDRASIAVLSSGGVSFPGIECYESVTHWWNQSSGPAATNPTPDKSAQVPVIRPDALPVSAQTVSGSRQPARIRMDEIQTFQKQLKGLAELLRGPRFLDNWQKFSSLIRIVGAPLQQQIVTMEETGKLPVDFVKDLLKEVRKHQILMRKLEERLNR